ncbi:hypothetical protein Tco_0517410 [Tanacetum coccineum]
MINPSIKVKDIVALVLKRYKCKVFVSQARRGKIKALQQYKTCLEDHYGMLWSYATEILNFNLKAPLVRRAMVRRMLEDDWSRWCFLKTLCIGRNVNQLVGRDGNNLIYPIAWVMTSGRGGKTAASSAPSSLSVGFDMSASQANKNWLRTVTGKLLETTVDGEINLGDSMGYSVDQLAKKDLTPQDEDYPGSCGKESYQNTVEV